MISQEGKLAQISYLVCRCTTLSTRTLLFLVEVKGQQGQQGSNCENLVNTISQEEKLLQIWYLICRCTTLTTRTLLVLLEVIWGQQGSNCENLVNTISQEGKQLHRCHIWYVGVPHWVQEPYCFWWRSFGVNKVRIVKLFEHNISKNTNFSSSKPQCIFAFWFISLQLLYWKVARMSGIPQLHVSTESNNNLFTHY